MAFYQKKAEVLLSRDKATEGDFNPEVLVQTYAQYKSVHRKIKVITAAAQRGTSLVQYVLPH